MELLYSSWFRFFRRRYIVTRVHRNRGAVAVTFDDGPSPRTTPRLLELLRRENAPATFFLAGSQVERFPVLAREIVNEGHEVGNHAYSHRPMSKIGFRAYAEEINATDRLIEWSAGRGPKFFRPPYGECGLMHLWLMMARSRRCILWSVDHHDYRIRDRDTLVRRIRDTRLSGGDILLFHDFNPATVDAMPEIIRDIRSRGFALATVSGLFRSIPARSYLPQLPPFFRTARSPQ